MRKLSALFLLGCAAGSPHPSDSREASTLAPPAQVRSTLAPAPRTPLTTSAPLERHAPPAAIAPPPYPPEVRSVTLRKTTALRKAPRLTAAVIGVIKKGTRAGVLQAAPGAGDCRGAADEDEGRWIQLAPRGWACEHALEPSRDPPTAPKLTSLTDDDDDDASVPGVYGMVRRDREALAFASREDALAQANGRALVGSNTVRARGRVTLDGRRYWRTSKGELIEASAISPLSPSKFKGVAIEDAAAMPAWVRSHHGAKDPVSTRACACAHGELTGRLAPRTVVMILEESADARFARVGDRAWVALADLRRATVAEPPPGTAPEERWFDIDLDQQVLVAYQGDRPVYATLVSTGKRKHATPTAVARVVAKLEHAAMTSEQERYAVADVPWTMYYDRDFALHTSYWHDGFGGPRSHGCVNLAPRDARRLYHWSSPDVPPGWIAVYGDLDTPGSLVRVRSRRAPAPAFRGYARTLHERGARHLEVASAR